MSDSAIKILEKAKFKIDYGYRGQLRTYNTETSPLPVAPIDIGCLKSLKKELFPFQQETVAFLEQKGGRALIGSEMGLGKTISALAYLHLHPEKRPVIIVCPAHLKLNWAQEIRNTLPGKQNVQILQGTITISTKITGDIIIINYNILHYWLGALITIKPRILILDEANFCKSSKALRTKATRKLANKCECILALTGTPIVNRPIECFNIIQMIDKSLFPNYWEYIHRYCGAKRTKFGLDVSGATNKEELHQCLRSIMIRHLKKDVLKDLPDKIYSYVPMEMDNYEIYFKAEADFIKYLTEAKGAKAARKAQNAEHLVRIEALKQLAVKSKMKQIIEWVENFIENNSKLIVFATHKTVIDTLMKRFGKIAVRVDGSVTAEKRDAAVTAFQTDDSIRLFVGNTQAAGTGLTLTAAASVAFIELPWTPGDLVQATDRCHRIGQKNTVNVYYLLAAGTIEAEIAKLLDQKRKVLDAILDGREAIETQLLTELIKSYQERDETNENNNN